MITEYDEFTKEELVSILLERDNYIDYLENRVNDLEDQIDDKINKDFEDNKKLASSILTNIVEGCQDES